MFSVRFAAIWALCAAVLVWGLSFSATKIALEHLSPAAILFPRFALAALLLTPLALRRGVARLGLAEHGKVLGICVLFPGGYFALETMGLRLTSATNASLIAASIPMVVLGLSCLAGRAWPTAREASGVAASLAGVALLVGLNAGPANAGDLMMLGAVLAASVYMVAAGRLRGVPPLAFTTLQMFWGAVFFLPFFVQEAGALAQAPAKALAAVAWLGLFCSAGGFLAYNYALSRVPAARASLFINAVPLVAALGAHVALAESVSPGQALGGALVLASVAWAGARGGA
ncbi:hypothetical protein NNJEOMEG_03444 [Fundidesulfovibrio magnetotacticus]|uniref:EamA domain-containing protein n=1 Tax=Fundidesulfovibrio magnetotacticus TaxID=2730080 RepID=A0A6V8M0N8_9BACT|nr:DMT family transporter [Fundidesulfovibrio magnetotacticus]GFK95576.1 hypothetical protein NNJEOMEG_03444 [Fundidesulfovibrio magnetotacticus]